MGACHCRIALPTIIALYSFGWSTYAFGDGGVLRAIAVGGGLQVSVFTSPALVDPDEVDFSVLVQHEATLALRPQAEVVISLVPRDRPYAAKQLPATSEMASNKLLKDCHVILEAGTYDVRAVATDGALHGEATFELIVGPAPTRAAEFWPWFVAPVLPIVLLAAHAWRTAPRAHEHSSQR